MNRYSPAAFTEGIWKEIESFLWTHPVPCLPSGSVIDGMEPVAIETTKRGVEVHIGVWYLINDASRRNPRFELNLCLSRPRFSTIESVTVEKVRDASLSDSLLDGKLLSVTLK